MKEIKKRMTWANITGLAFAYYLYASWLYLLTHIGVITGNYKRILIATSLWFIMAILMMIEIELRHERNDKV